MVDTGINWVRIEDALYNFAREQFSRAFPPSDVPVIWTKQGAAPPTNDPPYATLAWIGGAQGQGYDCETWHTDLDRGAGREVEIKHSGPRERTISLQLFAPRGDEADPNAATNVMGRVEAGLSLETTRAKLRKSGIVVIDIGPVLDVGSLVRTQWEPRAQLDLRLRLHQSVSELTGYIKTVGIQSESLGIAATTLGDTEP